MPQTIKITIPKLHAGQAKVKAEAVRFNVLECGRRFGKTLFGEELLLTTALDGKPAGWFAPTSKIMAEAWRDVDRVLAPLVTTRSKIENRLELLGGGSVDFWSVDHPDSGRGRKYARVIVDEASIIRDLDAVWQQTLRPTLTDYRGDAWFLGTPKGHNAFHKLFAKGQANDGVWKSWRLGTIDNPYIDPREIEDARRDLPDHVFKQEYLGIPADDGGNPFGLGAIHACVGPESDISPVVFGVDLAKSQDWTWVIGLDREGRESVSERWQADWGQTKRRILDLIGNVPTLIDATGVGAAIAEDLQRMRNTIEGFTFTAPSKQELMGGLAAAIQQRKITFHDPALINELECFEYEYTKTGVRYTAPPGLHDDGVCALALAVRKLDAPQYEPVVVAIGDSIDTVDPFDRGWR